MAEEVAVDCWGRIVRLPGGCCLLRQAEPSNIVQVKIGTGTRVQLGALRLEHELIFDVEDGILFIQRPSASPVDMFGRQFQKHKIKTLAYDKYGLAAPGMLFRLGAGDDSCLCSDYTIYDMASYKQKRSEAQAAGREITEGVRILVNVEFHTSNSDAAAAVSWQSRATGGLSVGMVPATGAVFMAHWKRDTLISKQLDNPRWIDVGSVVTELRGLQLFLSSISGTPVWPHPSAHKFKTDLSTLPDRVLTCLFCNSTRDGDLLLSREILSFLEVVDLPDARSGKTPLVVALEEAWKNGEDEKGKVSGMTYLELVNALLESGANPMMKDYTGVWPLLFGKAKQMKAVMAMRYARTNYRYPPFYTEEQVSHFKSKREGVELHNLNIGHLACAVFSGDVRMVELLLQVGVDPNQRAKGGNVPLVDAVHFAPVAVEPSDMIRLLLEHGADPQMKDLRQESALDIATKLGCQHWFKGERGGEEG